MFRIEGRDLRLDLPITLYEAVLGAKVNVPTLENAVELGIPAGTTGAAGTLRLRGKGLPDGKAGRGDLLVALRIVLPDDAKTELENFSENFGGKASLRSPQSLELGLDLGRREFVATAYCGSSASSDFA